MPKHERECDSPAGRTITPDYRESRQTDESRQALQEQFDNPGLTLAKIGQAIGAGLLIGILIASLVLLLGSFAQGQEAAPLPWTSRELSLHVPQEVLQKFRNPDGSCVQCSNGMIGTDQNVPAFAWLLWDSEYGRAVRGGSSPSRVAAYARDRNVKIWNITGRDTFEWMAWACASGRGAAIGAGRSHFQTLVGHNPETGDWYVVNNNGDQRIQKYSDDAFRRLHLASGPWCVILDYPPAPAPPELREWWHVNQSRFDFTQ